METNFNSSGKPSWWKDTLTQKGRRFFRVLAVIVIAISIYGAAQFAPGLNLLKAKSGEELALDGTVINNVTKVDKLDLPSNNLSKKVKGNAKLNLWEYTWNGNTAMIAANGGGKTTEGSLIEKQGLNLNIVRQDNGDKILDAMIAFAAEFDSGNNSPSGEMTAFGCSIMGDGAPALISRLNNSADDKFGEGKYHWVVKGTFGASYGEDKLIGDKKYLDNPSNLKGAVIITCVGDGDWVTSLNYIFSNKGVPVNPNIGTYDKNAVNFVHNPDIIECANEFIASQSNGKFYDMKEIENGKITGKTVQRKLDLVATWLPGDKIVFDRLPQMVTVSSTKDYPNQMVTTLIVLKEWSDRNPETITKLLTATYQAADQIKLYDDWAVKASQCVSKAYNFQSPQYWYEMFKGKQLPNEQIAGGSRIMNYADALQYYGLGEDGMDRYKSVYEQVANYLKDLNPNNFNESVKKITPYSEAVDLSSLQAVTGLKSNNTTQKTDYSKDMHTKIASGQWNINFNSGKSDILPSSNKELEELYNLLVQAEGSKITIEGHTDNTGSYDVNKLLSTARANSVSDWLQNKGIKFERIQSVDGKGSDVPVASNNTAEGRWKNRRVQITLLK